MSTDPPTIVTPYDQGQVTSPASSSWDHLAPLVQEVTQARQSLQPLQLLTLLASASSRRHKLARAQQLLIPGEARRHLQQVQCVGHRIHSRKQPLALGLLPLHRRSALSRGSLARRRKRLRDVAAQQQWVL